MVALDIILANAVRMVEAPGPLPAFSVVLPVIPTHNVLNIGIMIHLTIVIPLQLMVGP